jgi:hypothetical protein
VPSRENALLSRPPISLRAVLLAFAAFCVTPALTQAGRCRIGPVNYKGWSAQEIRNEWVRLTIVPKLGGRLMQVAFGPHEYLFVNKEYEGKYLPPVEPDAPAKWYNYGGDKIWPLPEGRHDDQHWPGPVADALDDGDYAFSIESQGTACRVRLDGPPDLRTGLQYSREISLQADSPKISFHAVMKNASGHAIEWSMQSVTQYNTANPSGNEASAEIWAFTPANESSAFPGGYFVRSGKGTPPGLNIENGLVALNYRFVESELWFDTQRDWLAVADAATQYAMVERFRVQDGKEYPGKATVIFYTHGSEAPDEPLYYLEAEINSPMARLEPGETYAMDTEWYPTRAGKDVLEATEAGVIARHLRVSNAVGTQKLTGAFGVFFPGQIVARFLGKEGKQISEMRLRRVTPRELVKLEEKINVPKGASRVAVHLIGSHSEDHGRLDEVSVVPGGAGE